MPRINDFLARIDFSSLEKFCREHGTVVEYARGQALVLQGRMCRHMGFVIDGYFKYTVPDSDGNECVTGFSFAGDAVTDFIGAFISNRPSITSIVAGCRTRVLQVPVADALPCMRELDPEFIPHVSLVLLEEAYRRYLDVHSKSPAERYGELCARKGIDLADIPVNELASYLSVSRRQFQRIRRDMEAAGFFPEAQP